MPGWPSPSGYLSPLDESYAETDVGCSLTSETMLVEAMLARAPKAAEATGKAKWYVESNEAPSLSKVKSRLTWQYMQHLIAMHENQVHGPGLLYSSELAPLLGNWNIVPETLSVGSDGGPDDLAAVNTDFTSYSMTSMAEDIRNSALTRISFHWSQIGVVVTKDGVTHVVRYDVGQHKIALRGYAKTIVDAPKTYPILANDPGSGQLVKVRFTTDMNKYGVALLNGVPQKIEYDFYDGKTLTPLGSRVPAWMAMIYENGEPTVAPKGEVDVGLDTKVTMYGIQFVNGITSTFTQSPPKDPNNNPLRHPISRVFIPIPAIKPSSGPVEMRKINPAVEPVVKGAVSGH